MTEYKNPQSDPGSQQRLLVALLLMFALVAAMNYLLPKPQPQPEQQKPAGQGQTATPTPAAAPATAAGPAHPVPTRPKPAVKQAPAETVTVLENDYYKVTFTNRGALAKSWVLKKFKDNKGNDLDLINPSTAAELGFPLSFFSYDKNLEKKLNEGLYVASITGPLKGDGSVTFEFSDGDTVARKTFRIEKMYVVGVETEVTYQGQTVQAFPQWPSGLGDLSTAAAYANSRIDWQRAGNIEHKSAVSGWFLTGKKWIAGGETFNGPFEWAAAADQYFAAAFMPEVPKDAVVVTLNSPLDVPKDASKPNEAKDRVAVLGVAVGSVRSPNRLRLFAGPKTVDALEATQAQPGGPDLRGMTDFGTFGFIARPLFLWLRWTYEHWIHNWGWAIAFLTVVITTALLPLRISSMKSSLKMQKIQPQIKAIQEKYKRYSITDPRKAEMHKEMQDLQKREGVNPLGGCLPMLLQMPFLLAFYSMLANAIELRHASWLWIKDLSAPDPYHILPIIIVITMYLSTKSMPQGGMDPAQQKIMNLMGPAMIGYMSWFFAAGMCVYWAISNLLGYLQQLAINRSELGREVRKNLEKRATRKK
ncbi:MAG TPA: membrane protein insertase YidC [Candidatus Angelobacter sp.]|nr:membrane protein insertase YidC [Candidatus Angelobacter sp.]